MLQVWPPGGTTCITTLPMIALLASSVGIELLSLSARVTSGKSAKGVRRSLRHPDPNIGPQAHLGSIKGKGCFGTWWLHWSKVSIPLQFWPGSSPGIYPICV